MPADPIAARRARVREDVERTVQSYAKMADIYTDAVTDHANAAVNYVADLFDQDQSAGDLVKDGLGLLIGCCRRQMKMWHDLCDAVHGDDREPPDPDPDPGPEPEERIVEEPPRSPVVLEVDAAAETTAIVRTPFRVAEIGAILKQDLASVGGAGVIRQAQIILSRSGRSGFVKVSVFGLRTVPPGTYRGNLTASGKIVQLVVIRAAA